MLKLTRKIEYSLMAMKYLCENENRAISAREIGEKFQIPFDTLSKTLQTLNAENIVCAIKGKNGGYKLSSNLDTLTFYDFCQIVEQKEFAKDCTDACDLSTNCNIYTPLNSLNSYLKDFLSGLTLKNLLFENSLFQISENRKEIHELQ